MPLAPTPPNGRLPAAKCSRVSLTVTPPARMRPRILSTVARSWLKGYSASGRSRPSTNAPPPSGSRRPRMGRLGRRPEERREGKEGVGEGGSGGSPVGEKKKKKN